MAGKNVLVLFVGGDVTDPSSGGEDRVFHLATGLSELGNDVRILQSEPASSPIDCAVDTFRRTTVPNLSDLDVSLARKLASVLRSEDVDVVQVAGPAGVTLAKALSTALSAETAVVYDAHNVERENVHNYLNPSVPFYKRQGLKLVLPRVEGAAVRTADHVLAVSERDRRRFGRLYGLDAGKLSVVRSGADLRSGTATKSRDRVRAEMGFGRDQILVVFHGSFDYYPNREALHVIDEDIAPQFRDRSDVEIVVAGKDVPDERVENVRCVGFVEDLHSFLAAADIAIAPLRRGGGTKLKILDYLSVGLPIVTTEKGAEGLALEDGEHAFVRDSSGREFVEALRTLVADPQLRREMGRRGQSHARNRFSWEKIAERLDGLYEELASGSR